MKKVHFTAVAIYLLTGFFSLDASAQVFVYPKEGQDPQQQAKDQQECQMWAIQQSGYNPASMASAPVYTSQGAQQGSAIRGAALGAARGAIIAGASDGDAGKGAAWGAGMGAVGGRMRSQHRQAEIAAAQNRAVQEMHAQGYNEYSRACKVCLEGRGYSVS